MIRLFLRILLNAAGIYLASGFIQGFAFSGSWLQLAIVSLIFTAVNFFFGDTLKFILRPLIFLSLGLLALAINIGTLWLTDYFSDSLLISGFKPLLFGTILMTVINMIPLKSFSKKSEK